MLDGCAYGWVNDFWPRQLAANRLEMEMEIPIPTAQRR